MNIFEGGNVFKDADKNPLTQRINQADIPDTIAFLEKQTGTDFTMDKGEDDVPIKWLGTTGRKADSGDLDLSVDANEIDKKEFATKLKSIFGNDSVKLSGDSVHLKTPIKGDEANGFVQTDFMFSDDPTFQQWSIRGGLPDSPYKGTHRHILLSSIARERGFKYSAKNGIMDDAGTEVITKDPNQMAKMLLGQTATNKDLLSVESIINYIKKLPNYEALVGRARETLGKEGVDLPKADQIESYQPGSLGWMRQMIDICS